MRSSILVVLSLAAAACGGDDLLLPRDGEPSKIKVVSPATPRQIVGQELGEPLIVEVTDPGGRPVANVEVLFVAPSGTVTPSDPVTTGPDGRAAVSYVLGPVAGEQVVEARAPIEPPANAVATIRIQAEPDVPQRLEEVSGDEQQAEVSTALPLPLAVKAVDRFGNGVPGVEVTWEVDGGGSVNPPTVVTGPDGSAVTIRLLGDQPGSYGTVAVAEALDGAVVPFTATATAAPRPELVITVQPSAQAAAGVPLAQQPQIQLRDPLGAPLAREGVTVTVQVAQGEGSVGGRTTATSDASGRVTFSDLELRGETGTRTLIFAAEGFTPVTSSPIAVAPGPPDGEQSSFSVPDGTAGEQTTISIRIRDEFGNNVAGLAGNLSISISGANPSSSLPVTDEGNGSYTASYIPVRTGVDEVTVRFGNQVLGGGPQQSNVAPGASDPATTTAQVIRTGVFFVRIDVLITVRDSQGNQVGHGGDEILISANDSAPRSCAPPDDTDATCVDNGDGTYTDAFVIIAGDVTVDITLNGVPISGSPFTP